MFELYPTVDVNVPVNQRWPWLTSFTWCRAFSGLLWCRVLEWLVCLIKVLVHTKQGGQLSSARVETRTIHTKIKDCLQVHCNQWVQASHTTPATIKKGFKIQSLFVIALFKSISYHILSNTLAVWFARAAGSPTFQRALRETLLSNQFTLFGLLNCSYCSKLKSNRAKFWNQR